jgi:hypothetical protein
MTTPAEMTGHRPPDLADGRTAFGLGIGLLGSLLIAALGIPFRDSVHNAEMALVLVIPVLLAAILGGRLAGAGTALCAALTFDFVFTQPYNSLRIADKDDVITFIVLFVVALIAAEAGVRGRRGSVAVRESRSEIDRLARVAELSAEGAPVNEIVASTQRELVSLLGVDECRYEAEPDLELPTLGRRGAIEGTPMIVWGEFVLPAGDIALAVRGRGHDYGRLVLTATKPTPASLEKRLVAVALADELGTTFAALR